MKYYKAASKIKHGASTSESAFHAGRDYRRQICGSRPARLSGTDAQALCRPVGRSLSGGRMRLTEIRIAGFGGQGVILAATVIGKAASIYQGAFATMTQNFGPEARGGS